MKMTKSQFKSLMKECLTELINEGAFDAKFQSLAEGQNAGSMKSMLYGNQNPSYRPQQTTPQPQGGVNPKILDAVRNVTSATPSGRKGLFEEILLDTALTTLQNQMSQGDGGFGGGLYNNSPASAEEQAVDSAQLAALAGGNPSRWAVAAFGGKKR